MERLGRHISIAGGAEIAFDRAEEQGCSAMQVFVMAPRTWSMGKMSKDEAQRFLERAKSSKVRETIAHMPYLPNLASPDKASFDKSVAALEQNLERCEMLGITNLVTHMGSHKGAGVEKGLENIAKAIDKVSHIAPKVRILLENEAGHVNGVGVDIHELRKVYEMAGSKRLGFCLDTCHTFAAGYDIREHSVLKEMDRILGFDKVYAIHVNDAKLELGSKRDRHEDIGFGAIGIEGFKRFFSYPKMKEKVLVLETPEDGKIDLAQEIGIIRKIIS